MLARTCSPNPRTSLLTLGLTSPPTRCASWRATNSWNSDLPGLQAQKPGLRVFVSCTAPSRDRSPAGVPGWVTSGCGGRCSRSGFGALAAGSRGGWASAARPSRGGRRRGVRAGLTTCADHTRVDLVGNLADDAGAVGCCPRSWRCGDWPPARAGFRPPGWRWRRMGAVNATATLAGFARRRK